MILEATLSLSKRPGMVVPPAVLDDCGHVVVEHLVEHDGFDEKSRDPALVENGMNSDQSFLGQVRSELQGPLSTLWLDAFAPGDADIEGRSEMSAGQVVGDRAQVMVAPCRPQSVLGWPRSHEPQTVVFDETVDCACGPGITVAQVVTHGGQNVLFGREEHVVDADFEPSAFRTSGEHSASIVGHDETNWLPHPRCERAAPVGCAGIRSVEIVLAALWDATLRDRRRCAGKLEGKLKHAIWG